MNTPGLTLPASGQPQPRRRQAAFSLVEVSLALGIVAFGLMVTVGLFGSLLDGSRQAGDRREIMSALTALHSHLDEEVEFSDVYTWAADGGVELAYVSYRSTSAGDPAADGAEVRGRWEETGGTWTGDYEAARISDWIRARLTLDDDLNPGDLGGGVDSYPHAHLVFQVELFSVPDRNLPLTDQEPSLTTSITVLR